MLITRLHASSLIPRTVAARLVLNLTVFMSVFHLPQVFSLENRLAQSVPIPDMWERNGEARQVNRRPFLRIKRKVLALKLPLYAPISAGW